MNMLNLLYFHKKRVFIFSSFIVSYFALCYKSTTVRSESFRLGVAGSLATLVCDSAFHIMDTVNIRMKVLEGDVSTTQRSTMKHVTDIYVKEGAQGFTKGFSACFYGSIASGFVYFYLYKKIKLSLYDYFNGNIKPGTVFLVASFTAEIFMIIVHYPYDLIKCRLQSKNNEFKYQNLPHAFR